MSDPHVLAYDILAADAGTPTQWAYFFAGIFGAGRNWGSVARRLVREHPNVGAVMVDLREHGESQDFPPPHTIAAAAQDIGVLAAHIEKPPSIVIGHSFGGKVALEYGRQQAKAMAKAKGGTGTGTGMGTGTGEGVGLRVWVVDSTPEAREVGGSAWAMLELLRRLPEVFASRAEAVAKLEAGGAANATAQWMATNLERRDDGLVWRFKLDSMEALLRDFFAMDLMPFVEDPPEGIELHFVKASESSIMTPEVAARIEAAGAKTGRVFLHHVEGGHWLNADNPDALHDLFAAHLD